MANTSGPWDQYKAPATDSPDSQTGPWAAYGKSENPTRSTARSVGDSAIALGTGVVQGVKMLTDVAGADNAASRALGSASDALTELESPYRKAQKQERAAKIQDAEATGSTWEEVKAHVGSFADAPLDTTLNALGTSAPTIAAGMLTGGGSAAAQIAARAAPVVLGVAQGVGNVKGQIHETVKQKHMAAGMPEAEATQRADAAQAYGGDNTGSIAVGGALGGLAGGTGVESSVRNLMGRKVASEAAERAAPGVIRSAVGGVLKEAPMEAAQGGQERLASNTALQGEGFDVPTWQGVAGQAALEGIAAAPMGGGFGAVEGLGAHAQPAQQKVDQTAATSAQPEAEPPPAAPPLALPAPVINVAPDGTAITAADRNARLSRIASGDVTDVTPIPAADPVREAVAAAAEQGGALSGAALTAIDSGAVQAVQPEQPTNEPRAISLEEADARDQAAYEQFFANHDADPVVARYFEDDTDIPDFGAASNVSDEEFLRSLGATDEDIQDAIATASQPAIPQSSPAVDAGTQANEPAGAQEGAGADQAAQGEVAATPAPAPSAPTNLRDGLARVRAQKQEAANAKAAAPKPAPSTAPISAAGPAAVEAAGPAVTSPTQGVAREPSPNQAVQASPQPEQAAATPAAEPAASGSSAPAAAGTPAVRALTNGAPAQNLGAQAAPAPGAQAAAPAGQKKAIERVNAGKAYYFSQAKAQTFVDDNGLGNTHEVVQDNKRFVVRAKPATEETGDVQQFIDGHHQALAAAEDGKPVKAIVLDAPVEQALEAVKNSPSAQAQPVEPAAANKPARKPRGILAKKALAEEKARADYFTPGNIVKSYGGHDRVVSYLPPDADGRWSVTVRAVRPGRGKWEDVPQLHERTHATQPDARELKTGPVQRAPTASEPQQESAAAPSQKFDLNTPSEPVDSASAAIESGVNSAAIDPGSQGAVAPRSTTKIEDFGETLHGARKMLYAEAYADGMAKAKELDTKAHPLSKTWPEPDYQKLLEGGAPLEAVSLVRALREAVPTKPQSSWKLKGWSVQVETLRGFAQDVLSGQQEPSAVRIKLNRDGMPRGIADKVALYEAVGHERSLKGIDVSVGRYSMYDRVEYNPPRTIWSVSREAKGSAFGNWPRELAKGDTREEAIAAFKKRAAELLAEERAPTKGATFEIYGKRAGGAREFFIGKKIGRNVAELKTGFADIKAARQYLADNQTELESLLDKYKAVPPVRNDQNAPRIGEDYRKGADVTPEQFQEAFGFRGVQFGNYVEGGRRQQDLNRAYDALMDLAGVLTLPPRALSLGGRLGLAFGARGYGGTNAAAAHYERGNVVINLTKAEGAGSLAHEWWHGLDNYFSRQRGDGGSYMTENSRSGDGVREEMRAAFREVMSAINRTGMQERSRKLDDRKTKDYWTTKPEMSARAFESYVIAKLQDQNAGNNYLANVVGASVFALEGGYPYPTAGEMPQIRGAFDAFFQAVETREGEGGETVLFSRSTGTTASYEARIDALFSDEAKASREGVRLLDSSDVMGLLGFDRVPLVLNESHVLHDGRTNHPEMTAAQWKKVPEWIENPAAVYSDPRHPGKLTIVAPVRLAGYPVVIAVEPNTLRGKPDHLLVTAFAKTTGELPSLGGLATTGRLQYADTKKAPEVWRHIEDNPRPGRPTSGAASILSQGRQKVLSERHLAGYRRANTPAAFQGPASEPTQLSNARLVATQMLVDELKANWARSPEIIVARNMQDGQIPERVRDYDAQLKSQGSDGEARGFIYRGKVYLLADQLKGPEQISEVLFHEVLGHYGLRGAFGDGLTPVLQQIGTMRRAQVLAKAREYGMVEKGLSDADTWAAMSARDRLSAAEEVLAEMAQSTPEIGFVQRAISAIRTWLRQNVPGFKGLALTDGEIVRNYILPARGYVTRSDETPQQSLQRAMLAFDRGGQDDSPMFSRASMASIKASALDQIHQTLTHPGKVSLWDKTVGTMRHLGERAPAFKPVFESAQRFIDDVSTLANDAADMAPRLLPRVETLSDLKKKPITAADNKAIARPIFEGTLMWGRDADGKAALVDDLSEKYANLPAAKKAQMLLATGRITEGALKMWQGLPLAQYETLVNSRFESKMLKAGVVWTDAELKNLFNATPEQVALYREARQAIDRSIDMTARADMLRAMGADYAAMRDAVLEAPTLRDAMSLATDTLQADARENPDSTDRLMAVSNQVVSRFEDATALQEQGYAPLSRFGQYTVDVVDAAGDRQYFGMFESMRDANQMAIKMRSTFPGAAVTSGTMSQEAYKLFAGITPESLEMFGNMLGLQSEGSEARDKAFQEYLQLAKNNHSALKRLIHRQGISGYSEDVGRVLASFVYSNARQAAGALNAGTMENAINAIPKEQGELKDVAMGLQGYISNPQEEGQAVRGMLFAQYLGGSMASAFVNMTQPFAVTMPYLSQLGGMRKASAQLARAVKDVGAKEFKGEPDLTEALRRAVEDGTVAPQEIHQLMAQARGTGSLRVGDGTKLGDASATVANNWERVKVAWGQPFALAEQFNRRSTFIAAYRIAKEQGQTNPADFARKAVLETQFLYSKANKARWARGAVGGTLMTFKTYSVSYLELLQRTWNAGTPGSPERTAGRRAVAWAVVMLMLMGGAGGLPFAEDAEDLIDGIGQLMGYNVGAKQWRKELLRDTLGKELGDFVNNGVSGLPGAPVDVSGRLGMGNLIPGTGLLLTKQNRERDLLEVVGPAGDLVARGFTGARKLLTGDVGGAALELSPSAVRNAAKGIDMASSGIYKDAKGYKVLDTTLAEAAAKFIGFQPRSVAEVQEANSFMLRSKSFYTQTSSEIKAQWAKALFEKDEQGLQQVRERLEAWNRNNPDQKIVVKMPDVWKKVREMGKDRTQRIADTAPKALRQQMREDAANVKAGIS